MRRSACLLVATAILALSTAGAQAQHHRGHQGHQGGGNPTGLSAKQRAALYKLWERQQMETRLKAQQKEKHWHEVMHQIQEERKAKAEQKAAELAAKSETTKAGPKSATTPAPANPQGAAASASTGTKK